MAFLCLTYDHQLVDGADAGRFLDDLRGRLEAPDLLTAQTLGLADDDR
jgi:pyruvate/2-oxoglutarate dehydrogenase complex dihydrolipoamide acyltransferase (E2) component